MTSEGSPSEPMSTLQVLLVDRAQGHLDGLRCAVDTTDGLACAGAAPSVPETDHPAPEAVDVVIIQAATPGADLCVEVETARRRYPQSRVVVVAGYVDDHLVEVLSDRGASSVVSTSIPLPALLAIAAGHRSAGPGDRSVAREEQAVEAARDLGLTVQQIHVLGHLAGGLSPQQIAHEHDLSISTVRDHLKRLRKRLGCANGIELVVTAHHMGLLPKLDRPLR